MLAPPHLRILAPPKQSCLQILHRLAVNLDDLELAGLLEQELGHDTHAGAYLEHGQVGTGIDGVGNAAGYGEVGQEVLTEILFGAYLFHIGTKVLQFSEN